jgi:putative nucleotidyltransferase with HDIG domain
MGTATLLREVCMSLMELIATKAGGAAVMLGIFVGVAALLRVLFGPGGRLREPQWDAWNEAARLEEAIRAGAAPSATDMAEGVQVHGEGASPEPGAMWNMGDAFLRGHAERFTAYVQSFFSGNAEQDKQFALKLEHTRRVLENAGRIAEEESGFAGETSRRALLLGALYHDVGRFAQFRDYGTYADVLSRNHGALGAAILRREGFLADVDPRLRVLARTAVCLHNRFAIPAGVTGEGRLALLGVRDADKLDILRVMEEHIGPGGTPDDAVVMHLKDDPCAFNPHILEALEAHRVASFKDMRVINDFRLLLCTWIFDLNYRTSRRLLADSGRLENLVASLSGAPEARKRAAAAVEGALRF